VRRRNPRVVMREKLMDAKNWLGTMTAAWHQPTQVYMPGHGSRPRRLDEYGEHSTEQLRELITYVRAVQVRLGEVEEIALNRIKELEGERG
jgi:hypothetical protein